LHSEEITALGFIHDVMATTLVLFLTSPAYGAIGKDLEARGFVVAQSDLPTDVLRPDGSHLSFSRDRRATSRLSRLSDQATASVFEGNGRDGRGCALPVFAARRPTLVVGDSAADRLVAVNAGRPDGSGRAVSR